MTSVRLPYDLSVTSTLETPPLTELKVVLPLVEESVYCKGPESLTDKLMETAFLPLLVLVLLSYAYN